MKLINYLYNYNNKYKSLKDIFAGVEMKPIIIKSSRITKILSVYIDVCAITLYPLIILNEVCDHPVIINHEKIHLRQQRELWIIPFYVLYILYWLRGKVQGMTNQNAYMSIPFEKEAYKFQDDFDYLSNRKPYAWRDF